MTHTFTIANISRKIAASLLLILPALTAAASYAHGHGSLSGTALGLIVSLCIAVGAWGAGLLLTPAVVRDGPVRATSGCA